MLEIFDRPFADPADLFLCRSPWPVVVIVSLYLLFVLKLGRQFMANRQPYNLQRVLKVYNIVQIVYNSLVLATVGNRVSCYPRRNSCSLTVLSITFQSIGFIVKYQPYDASCLMVMPVNNPIKVLERRLSYLYYLNKYVDLLDTVFIVLRKSYKQISALHLLHHLLMPISGYFFIRFVGFGGHPILMGLLNLFVHIIMYGYYYLSIHQPQMKRNIWWKKYITILQMVQFIIIFVHSLWTLKQKNCAVPRSIIYTMLLMSGVMFSMFTNFYIHAYILPKRKQFKEKKEQFAANCN